MHIRCRIGCQCHGQPLYGSSLRLSNFEIESAKAELRRAEARFEDIRRLETEGERLRIRCWDLAEAGRLPSPSASPDLANCSKRFSSQAEVFLEAWAAVRPDLPAQALDSIRTKRHFCRKAIGTINQLCQFLAQSPWDVELINSLQEAVSDLMGHLEQFVLSLGDAASEPPADGSPAGSTASRLPGPRPRRRIG
jgi:hypothetical protein